MATKVKNEKQARLLNKGTDAADPNPLDSVRPMSLSMGPTHNWLNATGDIEARAITEQWRPRFTIKLVMVLPDAEVSTWE